MDWKKTLLACLVILVAGGAATAIVFTTEPDARRTGATKQTAMLVDVTRVERGDFRPTIKAMGTVVPAKDIILSARVSGEIVERSDAFTPGGFVEKGEMLLKIDPSDYENALKQRRSELQQAKSDLKVEQGLQQAAMKEYEMYGDTLAPENRALVLREPQIEAAKANVASARAALKQAELNLARTTIKAPFDAHVLSRNANIGSQAAPGNNLGRLIGLDAYWVEATVPQSKVRWLTIPGQPGEKGSEVIIRNRTAWEKGEYRTGYLSRLIGSLSDQTRMARILITVPDPQNREDADMKETMPPLMIGSYVEASIRGKEIEDVIRIPRNLVRSDETVWVMKNGKLDIRDIEIMFQDIDYAYVKSGLAENDQVVTTNLSTVVEGAGLRTEPSPGDTTSSTGN